MNKGALFLVILALIAALMIAVVRPILFDKKVHSTSNSKGKMELISLGGDDYGGYWFLTSSLMKKHGPRNGFSIEFTNDGGAYKERLEKFAKKEYDAIVLPINSYLQHGAEYNFPGVIVAAISESRGADALVGFPELMPKGEVNDLNTINNKIVFTGESPSSFLLDLMITDFGMDELKEDTSWRREVGGAEEAYTVAKAALQDRSKGDAFVLWEPYVSKAIDELGYKKLWGSDQFGGYIIDVMVVHRDVVKKKGPLIQSFLKTYFRTLDLYAADSDLLMKEMGKSMKLDNKSLRAMMSKIEWFDLYENNRDLFGVKGSSGASAEDKIYASIIQCATVMEHCGNFDNSTLRDPYSIVNSTFLEELNKSALSSVGNKGKEKAFSTATDEQWLAMKSVGTMRITPISFQAGTNTLDESGEEVIDKVAALLKVHYPNYRVAVRGHTGPGDEEENLKLSLDRAKVVAERLVNELNIDPNRVHAEGYGANKPPVKKRGESMRSLRFRMARVEFVLLQDNVL